MERFTISQYLRSTLLEKEKLQPSHSQMVKEEINLPQLFYSHADVILPTGIDEAVSTVIKLFTTISIIGAIYTMYVYGKLIFESRRCFSIC